MYDARASPATQAQQAAQPSAPGQEINQDEILQWIDDLKDPNKRETALLELSKKRDSVPDLPIWLWYSFGTMAALLQEVIAIYPSIMPANLTAVQSNRVCNALALMQCVASHKETRGPFLQAHIPLYLYPFLHTTKTSRSFEYLRLTSLGVIGALVKTEDKELLQVISFLLSTEIIPLCLRIMEQGTELSKTVATFILQKILLDDTGLAYICQTYERFSHVAMILGKMVLKLAREPSARLLKHVIRCYSRLSDNARAQQALRQCLPDQLKDDTFKAALEKDPSSRSWLRTLMKNLAPLISDLRVQVRAKSKMSNLDDELALFESEISSLVESSSSDPQTVYISPDAVVSAPPISASEAKKKDAVNASHAQAQRPLPQVAQPVTGIVPGMIPAPMPGMLIAPQIRLGAVPVPPVGMPFMPSQIMKVQRQKISKEYQMKFFKAYIDTCIAIERERDIFEMKSKENAKLDEQLVRAAAANAAAHAAATSSLMAPPIHLARNATIEGAPTVYEPLPDAPAAPKFTMALPADIEKMEYKRQTDPLKMRMKDKKDKKKYVRAGGGQVWEDSSLAEWDDNDFRIFCGDLGNEVSDELLGKAFRKYPSFQKAKVIRDSRTNKSKGYGFVSFRESDDYVRAIREMDGKYVGNRPIKLRKSNWKDRNFEVIKKKQKDKKKLGLWS
ncbi:hypothetical protein WR25_20083 [Diploscapter pachys]|uniref:CCR4-NOT transcription complex subunit 9 n=1 Tax=Diploscapter pachys TaxID=2018661 RepID=A0A2A2L230_9BILA|nr:hypothetical protein WR25_20083 [Diploscapter pachys]